MVFLAQVLYLLSIGPHIYVLNRHTLPKWLERPVRRYYAWPVFWAMEGSPAWATPIVRCYEGYLSLWIDASLSTSGPVTSPAPSPNVTHGL